MAEMGLQLKTMQKLVREEGESGSCEARQKVGLADNLDVREGCGGIGPPQSDDHPMGDLCNHTLYTAIHTLS